MTVTASDLYSFLACPHRVTMDAFGDPARRDKVSPFVQMLWERGTIFERDVIAELGVAVVNLSGLAGVEKERETRAAVGRGDALIYGGRLSADDLLGEPDLLRREGGGYVAIDIKSGSAEEGGSEEGADGKSKRHYGVQIALYTDILIRLGLSAGRYGYIWDIHGVEKRYELDTPLGSRTGSLWDIYLDTRFAMSQALARPDATQPAASSVCKLCVWRSSCFKELRARRDLTLLPELGRARRDVLIEQFTAIPDLAAASIEHFIHGNKTDFPGIGAGMLRKFKARARLAVADKPQPYLTQPIVWPNSTSELFFDVETDPMRDLCYLHGFVIRKGGAKGNMRFLGIFAENATVEAEKVAFGEAMKLIRDHPRAIVVHYSKYERTEYRKLQKKYPEVATNEEIEALFAPGRAMDLYSDVIRPYSEWPTRDFSIKSVARVCGFRWRDVDPSGAASIEWFDQWVKTQDPTLRQRLLNYNEDDCRAMSVVLDVLKRLPIKED